MAINYTRMKATSTRLLIENGAQYSVKRKGRVTVSGGIEHHEPDEAFTAVGVRTDYKPGEIDGTVILNGDVRIVFTADVGLRTGDMVDVDGKWYRIERPNPIKPGKLLLCYRAQLRV